MELEPWKVATHVLFVLLVGTNACWVYDVVDEGISVTYCEDSLTQSTEALGQALALLPEVARDPSRENVLSVSRASCDQPEYEFEKEGYVWSCFLGVGFDEEGKLDRVAPSWLPFQSRAVSYDVDTGHSKKRSRR